MFREHVREVSSWPDARGPMSHTHAWPATTRHATFHEGDRWGSLRTTQPCDHSSPVDHARRKGMIGAVQCGERDVCTDLVSSARRWFTRSFPSALRRYTYGQRDRSASNRSYRLSMGFRHRLRVAGHVQLAMLRACPIRQEPFPFFVQKAANRGCRE